MPKKNNETIDYIEQGVFYKGAMNDLYKMSVIYNDEKKLLRKKC